jgi:hypothetical protein
MSETQLTGTCLKCGEDVRYLVTRVGSVWVHGPTGDYMSIKNGLHDANTYFQKD